MKITGISCKRKNSLKVTNKFTEENYTVNDPAPDMDPQIEKMLDPDPDLIYSNADTKP
jgi:hypothetical protein